MAPFHGVYKAVVPPTGSESSGHGPSRRYLRRDKHHSGQFTSRGREPRQEGSSELESNQDSVGRDQHSNADGHESGTDGGDAENDTSDGEVESNSGSGEHFHHGGGSNNSSEEDSGGSSTDTVTSSTAVDPTSTSSIHQGFLTVTGQPTPEVVSQTSVTTAAVSTTSVQPLEMMSAEVPQISIAAPALGAMETSSFSLLPTTTTRLATTRLATTSHASSSVSSPHGTSTNQASVGIDSISSGTSQSTNDSLSETTRRGLVTGASVAGVGLFFVLLWFIYRTVRKPSLKRPQRKEYDWAGLRRRIVPRKLLGRVSDLKKRKSEWVYSDGSSTENLRATMSEKPVYVVQEGGALYRVRGPPTLREEEDDDEDEVPVPAVLALQQRLTVMNRSDSVSSTASRRPARSPSAMIERVGPVESNGTSQARLLDSRLSRPDIASRRSVAYESTQQQPATRTSELSSISSGFGDIDIIIDQKILKPLPRPPPQARQSRSSGGLSPAPAMVSRFSWVSRKSIGARETVYTGGEEDARPRFRSVASWVNQQSGRLRGSQRRADAPWDEEEIPPVPSIAGRVYAGMPPEPQLDMMMDDGELPRRPSEVLRSP